MEGFSCREDTEVPQLIAHAKNFAEKARSRNNMSFLNGLLQVLNSPYVWCSIQRNGTIFSDTEKETEVAHIRASILKLTEVSHSYFDKKVESLSKWETGHACMLKNLHYKVQTNHN